MKKVIHNKISLNKAFFWGIISSAVLLPVRFAGASKGDFLPPERLGNPLVSGSIQGLIGTIADVIFKIGVPIAALFIIYSGLMFVTARGSEEQLKKAKMTFMWTIVGTAVLLGAKVIAMVIKETVKGLG